MQQRDRSARGADLPHAVTFFVSAQQRAEILRRLRRLDAKDRAAALCRALGVSWETRVGDHAPKRG